jgi:hypothetical protein
MALALRTDEVYWEAVESVFLALVRELPDDYIVVDQGGTGAVAFVRDEVECCLEWGVLVLGPGMVALIHVNDWADFIDLKEEGKNKTLTYLDDSGQERSVTYRPSADAPGDIGLEDVIEFILRSDNSLSPADRRFFANLQVGRATALPYAYAEWDPAIGKLFGCERLFTIAQIVAWLREMSDAAVFQDSRWNESRVRTFLDVIQGGISQPFWESIWAPVKRQIETQRELPEAALREEVSQAFPFPLAYAFRVVAIPQESRIDYPEKLRCAENFLAYLGSLGVALAQAAGLSLKPEGGLNVDLVRCCGISAGQWTQIVRETTRALRSLDDPDGVPIPEFSSLWWKARGKSRQTGTAKILERLVELRNDFHHNRGPKTPERFEEAAAEIQHKLLEVLRNSRFLTRYPLWYVTDCEAQRRSSQFKVTYRLCMGNHPRFEQREAQHDRPLVRRCVYLRSDGRLFDLTPWIVLRVCRTCGDEAMFFVDSVDRKKEDITYKSFERGHAHQCAEYWEDIARPLGLME